MAKVRKLPKSGVLRLQEGVRPLPAADAQGGPLPSGYTVKKRKLVRVDGKKVTKKRLKKAA